MLRPSCSAPPAPAADEKQGQDEVEEDEPLDVANVNMVCSSPLPPAPLCDRHAARTS